MLLFLDDKAQLLQVEEFLKSKTNSLHLQPTMNQHEPWGPAFYLG
jgi:hypothetical protein